MSADAGAVLIRQKHVVGTDGNEPRVTDFHLVVKLDQTSSLGLSNGAVEGMNNKIKSISHRSFGFRNVQYFIAAIYHCCARLPLPAEC